MYLKKLFQRSKSDLWNNKGRAILDSNMTPFFRFVNKWAIYRLGIISLAHGSVHVTDFPVVNVTYMLMNCHEICSNLAAYIECNIVRKRKYKLPSSNQSILPYLYS